MKNATQIFQVKKEQLGQFELIKLFSEENEISIVPAYGGHLLSLKMMVNGESINVLDSYSSEKELLQQDYYKSSLLLPFPNRMKDGRFEYNGKTYQFPVNDTNTHNNLHGFKVFYDMKVVNIDAESDAPSITLANTYDGHLAEYPFPFEFSITYAFSGYNELVCTVSIKNIGDTKLPIGFGWHPYFQFEGELVNDLQLEMPECEFVKIDDRMLPTGETSRYSNFDTAKKLNEQSFDNCFKSTSTQEFTEVKILSTLKQTQLTFWQETSKFPFFQIFTPVHRKSIALEPMTCNVDALNNKNGLLELKEGEVFSGKFGVQVRAI